MSKPSSTATRLLTQLEQAPPTEYYDALKSLTVSIRTHLLSPPR